MHHDSAISLLIVSDDLLARAGLAALLSAQSAPYLTPDPATYTELRILGESDCGSQLDALVQAHSPDILLWDAGWGLGETDDSPILTRLAEFAPRLPVVALIAEEADAQIVWAAGVAALLPRQADGERLAAGIRAAANGLLVVDAGHRSLLAQPPQLSPLELLEPLTPRETDVLALLADGLTNRAIARQLDISENTVKFHVQSLLGKLGAQSRTDAVVRATRLGLLIL